MKTLLLFLSVAWAAWGQCGKLVWNPDTKKLDCIGGNPDTAVYLTKSAAQTFGYAVAVSASASATTYTAAMTPTLTEYTQNMLVAWVPDITCAGGATTLNIDGVGAKPVLQVDGATNPYAGLCVAGSMYFLRYDDTIAAGVFRIVQGPVATAGWTFMLDASTTGVKGYVPVPYSCGITSVTLLSPASGTVAVTIKKSDYATFPSTSSICAGACPGLTAAQKYTDSTLTGWTTSVTAGDIIEYNVATNDAGVTNLTVGIGCQR